MSDSVPLVAEEITPAWLTTALRESGVLSRAKVRSVDYRRIGEGRCVNCVLRLTITYDPPEASGPGSIIAKLPSLDSEGRPKGTAPGMTEIRFYRELAQHTNIPTPRHYCSAWDDAGAFVLLLEDLGAGRVGRIDECCSVGDARVALAHLAGFHSSSWSCPDSTTPDWLSTWSQPAPGFFQGTWPVFAGKFPDLVTDDIDSIAETIGSRAQEIYAGLSQQPFTVIHCDFRLDNLCFDSPSGDPVAAFDWQLIRKGPAVIDLATFLLQSVNADELVASEEDLLATYHRALSASGVGDYPFETLLRGYRLDVLCGFLSNIEGISGLDLDDHARIAPLGAFLPRMFAAVRRANDALFG